MADEASDGSENKADRAADEDFFEKTNEAGIVQAFHQVFCEEMDTTLAKIFAESDGEGEAFLGI